MLKSLCCAFLLESRVMMNAQNTSSCCCILKVKAYVVRAERISLLSCTACMQLLIGSCCNNPACVDLKPAKAVPALCTRNHQAKPRAQSMTKVVIACLTCNAITPVRGCLLFPAACSISFYPISVTVQLLYQIRKLLSMPPGSCSNCNSTSSSG